ncbi:hypothetical protein Psesu_1348 [Pseudoxanthomonas suwonensis 11-1]|uniref:DUF2894 domain-containing protein n=1 Tax=Pseudoxanthomonas suwonensis (strain 11-1) TaxID=743721 RepID=E6WSI1_PSEUU|nr:DUF2894 domain-containing protein [Pseudoxanthomonas suwonensis]ADV27195.1 hypothetical protein Psesu_1348 [Pseudoxanthomonas suwonensis 11-1]
MPIEEIQACLARWRAAGADRAQPLRFAALEALARRAQAQQGLARARIEERLARLLERYAADLDAAVASPQGNTASATAGPLAEVTARLAGIARQRHGTTSAGEVQEMAMLGELRRLWAQVRSESQLRRSLQDLPEDAGPLNSGKLVHRALNLMGGLSPQYLRHFLAHLDTLAWIGQVEAPAPRPAEKAGKAAKATPARKRTRKRATSAV